MDPIAWIFVIIIGIGAIVAAIVGIGVLIVGWWFLIPFLCALVLGWVGFFFGLGLDVVILVIVSVFKKD